MQVVIRAGITGDKTEVEFVCTSSDLRVENLQSSSGQV